MSDYPFQDILLLIAQTKSIVIQLKESKIGRSPGYPFLDETLQHLEAAAEASMKAGVYSLPQSVIDNLPD